MDLRAYRRGVTLNFSRPSKPTENAVIEAFNPRLRAECLNVPRQPCGCAAEDLRKYFNEERPHGAELLKPPKTGKLYPPAIQREVSLQT